MGEILRPDLARLIFEIKVLKFGASLMKLHETQLDDPPSPIYFSFRKPPGGPLTEELIEEFGTLLWRMAEDASLVYGGVVGAPRAGDPLAAVSRLARVPQFSLIKEESDGRRTVVASPDVLFPAESVLLVDDLITKAGTKLEAVRAIRGAGGSVRDIVVIIDREQGGREVLERAGLKLHAAWRLSELLKFYCDLRLITEEQFNRVTAYLAANR